MCVRLEKGKSSKALSAEEMPSLTESFKEKECVFNLFFLERKDPHAIMDCLFFLFLFICLLPARDKQNIAQEYNICKWFHLVYVVAISVMTNTATLYSWVKSSLTSNSLKIQYPFICNRTTRIRLHTLTFQARVCKAALKFSFGTKWKVSETNLSQHK